MAEDPELKLLKFPEVGRVDACLDTVSDSWECELLGNYNMEMTLISLLHYAGRFDQTDPLRSQFYNNLFYALLIHREICESD